MKNQQLDGLATSWKGLTVGQRAALVTAVFGLSLGGWFAYTKVSQVKYSVLFANVDDKTASDVLTKLDAKGVPHKLDGNGTRILVPTSQLASTRLALAGEGVTGQAIPKGFDEIFANQGLASSDFEQRVNYERALEGELARTLLAMEPVAGANVQLSIPEQSIFIGNGAGQSKVPTASVMLSLRHELTKKQVDTIANMIASSVEGLKADQVTIASSDGTLLRAPGQDAAAGGSTANIDITRDFETQLSTRLTELARTLTGEAGATVEVRAVLDFTQATVEKEVINPDKNTPVASHELTETWTGTGTAPGGVTGVDGGPLGASGSGNGTYNKSDKTTTFTPGDRTITKSTTNTPSVTKLSIAVVIPVPNKAAGAAGSAGAAPSNNNATGAVKTSTVDDAMLTRLIGSAAGIDTTRGDTIEVAMVPAAASSDLALITDPNAPAGSAAAAAAAAAAKPPTNLIAEAAGGGAFVMLLLTLYMRRRRKKKEKQRALLAGIPNGKAAKGKKASKHDPVSPTAVMPTANAWTAQAADPDRAAVDEIKGDLERMLAESPESLAALLSSWMAQ
jgi:flagellar M-ring protein FliF